jgi:hypothetical protein
VSLDFLEKLLRANAEYENSKIKTDMFNSGKFHIEISALPESDGGGFYVTIPALGRWFAHTDDAKSLFGALDRLNHFLPDVITDEEHRQSYKEIGINIP